MDPVTHLFTAYLESIQNTVHARMTDIHGTEIKALLIDYQDLAVPYHYLSRVRDNRVCKHYKPQITQISKCTLAAKALLRDFCTQLSVSPVITGGILKPRIRIAIQSCGISRLLHVLEWLKGKLNLLPIV